MKVRRSKNQGHPARAGGGTHCGHGGEKERLVSCPETNKLQPRRHLHAHSSTVAVECKSSTAPDSALGCPESSRGDAKTQRTDGKPSVFLCVSPLRFATGLRAPPRELSGKSPSFSPKAPGSPTLRVKANLHLLQEGEDRGQTGLAHQIRPERATIHAVSSTSSRKVRENHFMAHFCRDLTNVTEATDGWMVTSSLKAWLC